MDIISDGKKVFDIEIEALQRTRDVMDDTFVKILSFITSCSGRVIITGIGKPGHIAKKIAATFASLGTHSFWMHPAEAMHGDLGMISEEDVVIAISYSGESEEIVRILANIKQIGATLIAITGNAGSTLAQSADIVQVLPAFHEACYLGLAPTSSTTAVLCYGDALAVVASGMNGFGSDDFGKLHPSGTLGKRLILKVDDLMAKEEENAIVPINKTLKEAIVELSKKGLGLVSVVDDKGNLAGVITDGDLRRQLEKGADVYSLLVEEVMTRTPVTVMSGQMAATALQHMNKKNISVMPVLNQSKVIGTIRLQSILNAGIY